MSSDPIVAVRSVSKAFQIYSRPSDVFKEALLGRKRHDLFWALRDVAFDVHEKQRVGIIGPNGAGKSTLLQIITGNLQPTGGSVQVDGKISALLSLVPAWSLEDTGIENIRFNLLLQGCNPRRIPSITEEIVEFTELGPFIYQPVRTYSSGMSARLSFTIATALEPDILVIDEVLAIGDAYFVGKAYKRMTEFCERGRALLFVSHATDAVRRMCDTVVWLQNGAVRLIGPAEYVLKKYEEDYRRSEDEATRKVHADRSTRTRGMVSLYDVMRDDVVRFRLISKGSTHFTATHYVRSVRIAPHGQQPVGVPLELVDLARSEHRAALDLLESEWGRIYERRDTACRALVRMTGRLPGGHILLKPPEGASGVLQVTIEVELSSPMTTQPLELQFLNVRLGAWEAIPTELVTDLGDGWHRITGECRVPLAEWSDYDRVRQHLGEESKPAIEILETYALVGGERTSVVRERQPFSIGVRFIASRKTPVADVSIKLMRSDGVYVFWQSSGMDSGNLFDVAGERSVFFHFDENCLGAGTYLVSSYVANGWDIDHNYPYSEVFCRSIDALKLEMAPERSVLDMGVVNARARIEVR